MMALIDNLFNKHKLVRRLGIMGIYFLITFATIAVFTRLSQVTLPVASAYGTLCALLVGVFKFYTDSRERDR